MEKYNHQKIEKRWQEIWRKTKLYLTRDSVKGWKNYYTLVEFPYPSGNLHVGHWYAFSVPDIFARFLRMRGKNVLYPIGFDAFGLPAENAAIKRGLNPRKWTHDNMAYMRRQMQSMGASFDWSREVVTCEPEYYRWNQWIFNQFFKKGLAYQSETAVNWCPSCKTVLANEQVINGKCERCDSEVLQRQMKQWQLRITDYAEKLLAGLEKLNWPEEIKDAQRNWIGKSEGAEIEFRIKNQESRIKRFVLLHGFEGSPKGIFFPWLAAELKRLGYEVEMPQMPNTKNPVELEQVEYVLRNCKIDENTIVVGHSLGAIVAQKVILKRDKPVGGLIMIAAAMNPDFPGKKMSKSYHKTFSWKVNYEKLNRLAPLRMIISDLRELESAKYEKRRVAYLRELATIADAKLFEGMSEKEHFTAEQEPFILQNFLNWIPCPTGRRAAFAGMTGEGTGMAQEGSVVLKSLTRPVSHPLPQAGEGLGVRVFTTRPDTIFGATYLVLAPEHKLIQNLKQKIQNWAEVEDYINKAKKKTELQRTALEKDKTGVELKGVRAINPATGEEIPIWIADYVLTGYGTGAIMAVPQHDERDRQFAEKFDLPIVDKPLVPIDEAIKKFGAAKIHYKLRDWIISRQRYWGTPIPIIHCNECGPQPVPDKDLPVELPEVKDYLPRDDGRSPLAKAEKWVKVKCPKCGGAAERETDTMDTFVDSSWYFLRYADPKNKKAFASLAKMKKWLPVKRYSGGAEHTTMHLLYSRFWIKAMHDLGLVPWDEPYLARMNRGLILGPDGQKMSKSRGNVVDPDKIVKDLGADTVRMYLAFIGPYNEVGSYPWNPKGILGVRRFLERVWRIGNEKFKNQNAKLQSKIHKCIKKVGEDIEAFKFNTAIAAMMSLISEMEKEGTTQTAFELFLGILAPFAPHLTEELWQKLGHKKSIHLEPWPEYDEKLIQEDVARVAVQVNGKLRGMIQMPVAALEVEARAAAEKDTNVAKYLSGAEIKKVIYVKGKIINFVI